MQKNPSVLFTKFLCRQRFGAKEGGGWIRWKEEESREGVPEGVQLHATTVMSVMVVEQKSFGWLCGSSKGLKVHRRTQFREFRLTHQLAII